MLTRRESKQIINFIKREIKKDRGAYLTDGVVNLSKRVVGNLPASRVNVVDADGYYDATTVEGVLDEVGETISGLIAGSGISYGLDTVASGDTSVVVSHNLYTTPNVVTVTGKHSETSSLYVTSVDSSGFTVNTAETVTDDRDFYWYARV
jgi:hypothetical protein